MEEHMTKERIETARSYLLRRIRAADSSIRLFLDHHRAELPSDYFRTTFRTVEPQSDQMIERLVPRCWQCEESYAEFVDFRFPGDVSQYVLSVELDKYGQPISVQMES